MSKGGGHQVTTEGGVVGWLQAMQCNAMQCKYTCDRSVSLPFYPILSHPIRSDPIRSYAGIQQNRNRRRRRKQTQLCDNNAVSCRSLVASATQHPHLCQTINTAVLHVTCLENSSHINIQFLPIIFF